MYQVSCCGYSGCCEIRAAFKANSKCSKSTEGSIIAFTSRKASKEFQCYEMLRTKRLYK